MLCASVQVHLVPAEGLGYEQLKEAIKGFEANSRTSSVQGRRAQGKGSHSTFRRFDSTMQLVDRGGRGVEWAWVRNKNVDLFVSNT